MVVKSNNPCFECEHRRVGCHISCAQHLQWCKQQEEHKKMVAKMRGIPYYSKKGNF